jgi:hypothetical protein
MLLRSKPHGLEQFVVRLNVAELGLKKQRFGVEFWSRCGVGLPSDRPRVPVMTELFPQHPFPDVRRTMQQGNTVSLTGIEKANGFDIHEVQFLQIQNCW